MAQLLRRISNPDSQAEGNTSVIRNTSIDNLGRFYINGDGLSRYLSSWRKKIAWRLTVFSACCVKRFLDILIASISIVLFTPLFAFVALLIKLTDGGPILFWQTRVGREGREFAFPKFRSMRVGAEQLKHNLLKQNDLKNSITFKMKNDPRVTWLGRILRKYSIDELPQLWCVIQGDMSLVGPRPPLPCEAALYSPAERRRLDVTPGLTCLWQISGRSNIPFPKQVELDVQYIESRSLLLDIQILLKTIPAVILGRGAY